MIDVKALPYTKDSLKPVISTETVEFHYDKLYEKRTYYLKKNEKSEVKIDSVALENSKDILDEMSKEHWK